MQFCKNNCTNPVKAHTSGACRGLLLWRLNIPQQASGGQYLLTTLFRPTLLLWTGQKWTFIYLDYDHGRFNNILSWCGGWHRVSEINYMYFQKRKLNITRVKLPWQWQFWTVMGWVMVTILGTVIRLGFQTWGQSRARTLGQSWGRSVHVMKCLELLSHL